MGLSRSKPQSLTSHFQAQLTHCLQPPGLSRSPVPARTPPTSHPLPHQPHRFSTQQAEYPTRQHHPHTDNIISQPSRWHCADPACRTGTVPLQGTPWLVAERKRRDANRNRVSRTGFLCMHTATRPHPTPSPQAIFPSQAFLIAAPRGGCPSPSTWVGGDIHLSARARAWASLLQPCGAEGAKSPLQTVNICLVCGFFLLFFFF